MNFRQFLNEDSDKYTKDTVAYIDGIIKKISDEGDKKFLNGLKSFLSKEGFLTADQLQALGKLTAGK